MTKLMERLRVEVAGESTANRIENHSGQMGDNTGGIVKPSGTTAQVSASGLAFGHEGHAWHLDYHDGIPTADITSSIGTPKPPAYDAALPISPGEWLAVTLRGRFVSANPFTGANLRVTYTFYGQAGAVLGSPAFTLQDASGQTSYVTCEPRQAPPGTAYVSVELWVTSGAECYVWHLMVVTGATAERVADVPWSNAEPWQNIVGPLTQVAITRGGALDGVVDKIDVGMLTVTGTDLSIAPELNARVRPGWPIRVLALDDTTDTWEPLFTGHISNPGTTYGYDTTTPTIVATDGVARLAKASRPYVFGTHSWPCVEQVGYTASGHGLAIHTDITDGVLPVPDPETSGTWVTAVDESATALRGLELARNTDLGVLYVDKANVIQYLADDERPGRTAVVTFTDSPTTPGIKYTAIDTAFDSANVVNSLLVNLANNQDLQDEEDRNATKTYGPFLNASSAATWGESSATIDVIAAKLEPLQLGITPAGYAAAYLGPFAEPTITAHSVTFVAFTDGTDKAITEAIGLELYQAARVQLTTADLDETYRVLAISHTISATRWETTVGLRPLESELVPVITPPPGGENTGPADYLPGNVAGSWTNVTYDSGYNAGTPGQLAYKVINGIVWMRGGAHRNSGNFTAGSFETVSASPLPPELRPPSDVHTVTMGTGSRTTVVRIRASGNVDVAAGRDVTGVTWVGCDVHWPIST